MRTIILDIETWCPGWQDGERGWEADSFAPTAYHEPVVIVWLVVSTHREVREGEVTTSCDLRLEAHRIDQVPEAEILQSLADDFRQSDRLVTWNGRSFDMPVLSCRALALGIDWAWWHKWRHRFPGYREALKHYDLLEQLGDYGAARGLRLDRVARICGLPGKPDDVDGSKVQQLWMSGERQIILEYCIGDVLDLYGIYLQYAAVFFGIPAEVLAERRADLDRLRARIAAGEAE